MSILDIFRLKKIIEENKRLKEENKKYQSIIVSLNDNNGNLPVDEESATKPATSYEDSIAIPAPKEEDIFCEERFYKLPSFDPGKIVNYDFKKCLDELKNAKNYQLPSRLACIALFLSALTLENKYRTISLEIVGQLFDESEEPIEVLVAGLALCARGSSNIDLIISCFRKYLCSHSDQDSKTIEAFFPFATDVNLRYHLAELFLFGENHHEALETALPIENYNDSYHNVPLLIAKIYREIDPILATGYIRDLVESNRHSETHNAVIAELYNPLSDIKNGTLYDRKIPKEKNDFDIELSRSIKNFLMSHKVEYK